MQRKKIYYVPGVISLLFLPLVLYLTWPAEKKHYTRISMYLPKDTCDILRFTHCSVEKSMRGKKVIPIQFYYQPYDYHSQDVYYRKLDFVRRQIEQLSFTHDTTSVLKVVMGQGIAYEDVVSIFNDLIIYEVKRYALVGDSLFIFANTMPGPPEPLELPAGELTM